MKVSELIAELKEQNPDAPVLDEDYTEAYNLNFEKGGDRFSGLPEIDTGYVIICFDDPLAPPEEDGNEAE